MAKVKITGHASGTGVITVTAPNTSTDRTITLPDATATIATTADVTAATFNPNAAQVFNESGADVDFRVESDTKTHALFVDGALGRTGINKAAPEARLDIVAAGETGLRVVAATSGEYAGIFQSANTNSTPILDLRDSGGNSKFKALADGRGLSDFTAFAWCLIGLDNVAAGNANPIGSLNISSVVLAATGNAKFYYTNAASTTATSSVTNGNTAGGTAVWNGATTAYIDCTYYHSNGNAISASGVTMISFGGN